MAKDQTTTNSDRLIFDEVKERLRDQFESIDSIDTKAGIVLGFDGAILAALLNSEWLRNQLITKKYQFNLCPRR